MATRTLPPVDAAHPVRRAEALARLHQFMPLAGADYASGRNFDHGPGRHDAVSRLSAALARRTITEAEVVSAVLSHHGDAAASFVSEVFWRSYFKGWLEARPQIWQHWLAALDRLDARLTSDDTFAARQLAAVRGETGIDCFDHWMGELASTGYLHNWARMQVASIWIFTLGLPWELGARHFLDHLIDADAASNTLSWRWVAGLHTRGKTYLADPARIARMTGGRFAPQGLATRAPVPDAAEPPPATAPRAVTAPDPAKPAMVWITREDGALECDPALADLPVRAVAIIDHPDLPAADRIALHDALERAADRWQVVPFRAPDTAMLAALAADCGVGQVVTGRVAVGSGLDPLHAVRAALHQNGIALAEHWRAWDQAAWPHTTRGFFGLREKIPQILAATGLPEPTPSA
jgi:deoxyribodipyrimidine photo-lyase